MQAYFCQNTLFLTILQLPLPKSLVLGSQNEQDHSRCSTLKHVFQNSKDIFITQTFVSLQSVQSSLWRNKGFMLMVLTSKP